MTVIVKKEWLRSYSRAERLGGARSAVNWHAVSRYGWLLLIAFITVFFYIWQNLQIIRAGYEIEGLKKKLTSLQNQNTLLTMEVASLEDLNLMEQRAGYELGMVRPAPGQTVYVGTQKKKEGVDGQQERPVPPLGK